MGVLRPEHGPRRSYALRGDDGYWLFMTTMDEWEAAGRGEGGTLWQSDTPPTLSLAEAEAVNDFVTCYVGEDPFDLVECDHAPTHRFADDPHPRRAYFPQLERIRRRCPDTLDLFAR